MRVRSVLAIFLLGAAVHASMAMAQTAGTFTATSNMTAPRSLHTATLLANGKVLITRGMGDPSLAAELYDPATRTFTAAGHMIYGGDSAALLPDGRVLCFGDRGAELYDPSTGIFTATGGSTTGRGIATLLGNGKVLITGNTAQLFDPATATFTSTGAYAGAFPYPETATLLPDGRVLIVGNADNSSGYLEHEELYDPVTGTFKLTGKMHTYGCGSDIWSGHTATLLPNGKVLLAGGTNEDCGTFSVAELYDPSTDTFTLTANMTRARAGHTATLLPDGTALLAGGQFAGGITSAELYNPATGTFSATGDMTTPRLLQAATLLPDGTVLMTGGERGGGVALASAELYTPLVLVPAPVLFPLWHAETGQLASPSTPAVGGEALAMYTTSLVEGGVIPPQVAIGGKLAEILYFGDAPGYPGYFQVNVRVPSGVSPGPAVSVRLTYLGRPSNQVTIGMR